MGIAFNNKMILPSDFAEMINTDRLRQLKDKSLLQLPLIEILSEPGEDSISDMLNLDWEITEFSEKGIDFKIIYKDPLEVSQNDEPDIVKVKLNLSQFTDEYG